MRKSSTKSLTAQQGRSELGRHPLLAAEGTVPAGKVRSRLTTLQHEQERDRG